MNNTMRKGLQQTYRRSAISALPIEYRPLKHIAEFLFISKEVWPHKIHHTPVFLKVVL